MDRVLHGPRAIAMDRDAEQEHAEIARDPREILQAALRAQRPGGGKCGPRDEAREQGQRDPGRARPPTGRQQPPGRSDEHDPPDDDRHLAPHDLVIAAPVDREVEHDRAGERPRPHGVRLDPTQGVRPPRGRAANYRFHLSSIRRCSQIADAWSPISSCSSAALRPGKAGLRAKLSAQGRAASNAQGGREHLVIPLLTAGGGAPSGSRAAARWPPSLRRASDPTPESGLAFKRRVTNGKRNAWAAGLAAPSR